jgi:dolichol kinase
VSAPAPTPWSGELGRKGIHLCSALFPLALAYGWVPRTIVLAVLGMGLLIAAVIEIGRRQSEAIQRWFLSWFGWMLRSHETTHLTGASWILLTMFVSVLVLPLPVAITALWAAVVGDTAAALVGRSVSQMTSPTVLPVSRDASRDDRRNGARGPKTWSGSLACAVASAIGPLWLVGASLPSALAIGVAAAAAERPTIRLDDNVRVAVGAGATAWALLALGRFPG